MKKGFMVELNGRDGRMAVILMVTLETWAVNTYINITEIKSGQVSETLHTRSKTNYMK